MQPKRSFIIIIAASVIIAALGLSVLFQYKNIKDFQHLIDEETTTLKNISTQLAKAHSDEERERLRLLSAQHSLNIVNPPLDENAPRWQRVRELLREGKGERGKKQMEFVKSYQPQRPPPPKPANYYYGNVFLDLLDDPEYAALATETWNGESRERLFRFMRANDIADSDKLAAVQRLLAESHFDDLDMRAAAVALGLNEISDKVVKKLRQDVSDKHDAAMKALVGEEAYNRYIRSVFIGEGIDGPADRLSTDQLVTRLSYSSEPLTENQQKQIRELVYTQGETLNIENLGRKDIDTAVRKLMSTDAFNADASKILSTGQMQALQELQDEKRAFIEHYEEWKKQRVPIK